MDHFREEDILTRPQFDAVAEESRRPARSTATDAIAATENFVDAAVASGDDVVIADALMPFVPTLLAMGHDEETIDAFMTDLTEVLTPVELVMVLLAVIRERRESAPVKVERRWRERYIPFEQSVLRQGTGTADLSRDIAVQHGYATHRGKSARLSPERSRSRFPRSWMWRGSWVAPPAMASSVCMRCGLTCAHATLRRRRSHRRGVPRVRPE